MKRALVMGAGGFIGSHLVRRLAGEGVWVRGVDLQRPRYAPTPADEFRVADLRDPVVSLAAVAGGFDEVYQLAAEMGGAGFISTGDHDADIMHNSALINLNVLRACADVGVGRLFYSSSACVYPEHNQRDTEHPNCREDSAYPAAPDSEYGWEKLFSERLYLSYARNHGVHTRIGRLHNIFGPEGSWNDGREKAPAALCRKVAMAPAGGEIEVWGDGRQTRSFLWIDEGLEAVVRLMRSECSEPVNIGSDQMVTIDGLTRMIVEISGKALSIRHVPGPLGVRGRTSDNRLIRTRLGWAPGSDLREGLARTYAWIDAQVKAGKLDRGGLTDAEPSPLLPRLREAVRGEELIDWSEGDGENDFRRFRAMFEVVELGGGEAVLKDGAIYAGDLRDMIRLHTRRRTAHVLFTPLNENWGAFATTVPGRTAAWGDWHVDLTQAGCPPETVRQYLDDPAVKAVVATQHTTFCHPAILTLPIGLPGASELRVVLDSADGSKRADLLLNNSGWGHRRQVNERVIANFGGRLHNSYGLPPALYHRAIAGARFVLCPSGMGWDSYRVWETLALGSIPVVEYSPGWHTVLDDLPALFVTRFDEVTPRLLASAYPHLLARADRFDYGKLTRRWWARRILARLRG